MRRRRQSPPAPIDVRIVEPDGTEHPVQTMFVGYEDGIAMWEVVDLPTDVAIRSVHVGALPGRTGIRLPR